MNRYTTPLKNASVPFNAMGVWNAVVTGVPDHRLMVRVPRLSGDMEYGPLYVLGENTDTYSIGDPVIVSFLEGKQDELIVIGRAKQTNETLVVAPTFTYKVGDTGPGGGIIFFVDRYDEYEGFTYLEVAPSSTERLRTWAPSTPTNYQATAVTGADSKALGGGYQNTIDIVAQGHTDTATSAAYYCDQLTFGGQSDWYLPSFAEMKMVYDVVFLQLSVTGFAQNFYYWTSSERHTETNIAHTQYFATGQQFYAQKSSTNYVRPVRRFS